MSGNDAWNRNVSDADGRSTETEHRSQYVCSDREVESVCAYTHTHTHAHAHAHAHALRSCSLTDAKLIEWSLELHAFFTFFRCFSKCEMVSFNVFELLHTFSQTLTKCEIEIECHAFAGSIWGRKPSFIAITAGCLGNIRVPGALLTVRRTRWNTVIHRTISSNQPCNTDDSYRQWLSSLFPQARRNLRNKRPKAALRW